MSIAVVVPTIREECWDSFLLQWSSLFNAHDVELIKVRDGERPLLTHGEGEYSVKDIMGRDEDLIYNKNDGVRNLGFMYIAKELPDVEYILTLDDDLYPIRDTIRDHLRVLNAKAPVSWISTLLNDYPRGFPYKLRSEAEVVLSHGMWEGVADWDAPTQLIRGNPETNFYVGPIPKGIYYPMCGMNVMFKRKMLPYMYWAPMGYRVGMDRFADIWLGINSKRVIDEKGWAAVTGYAHVYHERASNVWANLKKEAPGLELNEDYWEGNDHEYFDLYDKQRSRWEDLVLSYEYGSKT